MNPLPPDKLLHNSLKHNASLLQRIELLPRLGGGLFANHQRTERPEQRGARSRFLAAFFALTTFTTALLAQEADLIVHHGKVVTVDGAFSVRQAMAVKNGLILRVGTDEEVLRLKGPDTEVF